jgi:hypothetical protein
MNANKARFDEWRHTVHEEVGVSFWRTAKVVEVSPIDQVLLIQKCPELLSAEAIEVFTYTNASPLPCHITDRIARNRSARVFAQTRPRYDCMHRNQAVSVRFTRQAILFEESPFELEMQIPKELNLQKHEKVAVHFQSRPTPLMGNVTEIRHGGSQFCVRIELSAVHLPGIHVSSTMNE